MIGWMLKGNLVFLLVGIFFILSFVVVVGGVFMIVIVFVMDYLFSRVGWFFIIVGGFIVVFGLFGVFFSDC